MSDRSHPRNGYTVQELATMTGASPRSIITWTSEPRVAYLNRVRPNIEEILRLRATGLPMRAIAAEVGCSVGTVHRYLNLQRAPVAAVRVQG